MKTLLALLISVTAALAHSPAAAKCFPAEIEKILYSAQAHPGKVLSVSSSQKHQCRLVIKTLKTQIEGESDIADLCSTRPGARVFFRAKGTCCDETPCMDGKQTEILILGSSKGEPKEYWYRKYQHDEKMLDEYLQALGQGLAFGIQGKPAHLLATETEISTRAAKINGWVIGYEDGIEMYRDLTGGTTGYRRSP